MRKWNMGMNDRRSAIAAGVGVLSMTLSSLWGCGSDDGGRDANFSGVSQPPPAANEGDRYDAPGTQPFVMTEHDPLSTFAADVDTASYDIFRRDIEDGALPRSESVRLEEYVNYFNYEYRAPAADAEHPFNISLAAAPDLLDSGTHLLRVGIQGQLPSAFEKQDANLVYLVDVSGSMSSGKKLRLAKHVLNASLKVLEPNDTVSIVTYASGTRVHLRPTAVEDRSTIERAIGRLSSGGGTAGSAGLTLAYEQAQKAFIEGGINHVVLCTDGDFNIGPSSTQDLLDLITEKRRTGITLTALGFGSGNLNDQMMEAVSNAGNGMYGVISSETQADNYVENRLLATLQHIAKDVKIQVEFSPELVSAYRLMGYENRAIADDDFRNDVVDAGEIGAGHQVTALYQLVLAGGRMPEPVGAPSPIRGTPFEGERQVGADELVLVKVRYKQPDAREEDAAQEVSARLTRDSLASLAEADADLRWAASVAAFAEILKESPFAERALLPAIETQIDLQAGRDPDRAEFAELFDRAHGILQR